MMQMLPCCYKFQKKFLKFSHYKGATYQQNWQTPKKKHGHRPCFHALPKTNKMPWRTNIFKNGNHLQRNLPKSCCHCLALWQWTSWVYWVHYAWCIVPPVIQWMLWATQQPRKISDNILADASAQCRRELLICNKAAKQLYDIYKWIIQSLHSQFQEIINEDYLAELDDPNISPHQCTTKHYISTHCWSLWKIRFKYGECTKPFVVHTKKQGPCQAIVADTRNLITMAKMV